MIWQRNADPYGSQKNDKGFTLIELLVVIFIISLLSLLVLTWLNSGRGKGRLAAAQQTMRHVRLQAAVCLSAGEAVNIPGSSGPVSDNNNGSDLTICSGGVQRYPALPFGWIYCNGALGTDGLNNCGNDTSIQTTNVSFRIVAQSYNDDWKITCGETTCESQENIV